MIVGKRIQLRAIEYEDLPLMIEWRNDPKVYQFFLEHEPLSMIMQRKWFDRLLQRSDEKLWIAEIIENKQPVGTIGLMHIDWRNRNAELARVLIVDEYRRCGFGSELLCLVLRYFFDHLNMNKLYCHTLVENKRAVEFYVKLGFEQEGVFRQHIFKAGRYCSLVRLAILQDEYRSTEAQAMIAHYLD